MALMMNSMQNKNELATFQYHSGAFAMVMWKFACLCETDFHRFLSYYKSDFFDHFHTIMWNFACSCETGTPLISLCAIPFNYPYFPCFNFDLCTIWSIGFLVSWASKEYIACPKMTSGNTPISSQIHSIYCC